MSGPECSPPAFGTLDDARATLRAHFGYPDFRPPQRRAVEAVLSGRDALVVLPTGGGKSLCYQVPALMRQGLTVVVSPLISLMKDQVEALERRGVGAAFINSTLTADAVAARLAQARGGAIRMLYLAPERLEAGRTLQQLASIGVSLLAVDEAHCISEWGHDFRPSYRRIGAIRAALASPQTVALTATATPQVRTDIVRQLALRDAETVVGGFDRTNLTYFVLRTPTPRDKDVAVVRLLRECRAPCIVYTPTRTAVERVTAMLVQARIRATAYHGGLPDSVRQRAQDAFMDARARVIVATSAFGMGIDKPDVRLVVHHAMPGTLEAYYQEAGRAGRDGAHATCVLLHAPSDRSTHEFFIASAHPPRAVVERVWTMLREAADPGGVVTRTPESLASRLPSSVGAHRVGAALRVLASAGLCRAERAAIGAVWIRLLATPARIRRELTDDRTADRALLRALWRAVGSRLSSGALCDLSALSLHDGRWTALVPILERLEAQQFVMWTRVGGGLRIAPRARRMTVPPIDWARLAQRRHGDLQRLEAMQQYAHTRYCRRAFVLRYFGDPDARAHCGACDRCLGTTGLIDTASFLRHARIRSCP